LELIESDIEFIDITDGTPDNEHSMQQGEQVRNQKKEKENTSSLLEYG